MDSRSSERSRHRVRVPRKKDANGNAIPHTHRHPPKLYKHRDGTLEFGSEAAPSTSAVSMYPNTTRDVTSITNTNSSIQSQPQDTELDKKTARPKFHYDKNCGDFRGRPLHVLEPLSQINYDSAAGDEFALLEREEGFKPRQILKGEPRFRGKCYFDTQTLTESTLESGPLSESTVSETEGPPRTDQSFTNFMGTRGMSTNSNTFSTLDSVVPVGDERIRIHPDKFKDPFEGQKTNYDYKNLVPKDIEYSLLQQYAAGTAITKLEDIMLDESPFDSVDEDYVPPRPSEFDSYSESGFVTATIGSAEYVEDSADPNGEKCVLLEEGMSLSKGKVRYPGSQSPVPSLRSQVADHSKSSVDRYEHSTHNYPPPPLHDSKDSDDSSYYYEDDD